ncbi:MAG TPA: hypothetical protein EYG82_02560 [Sulfurovum sp.]|nr:hypothetical protein [Sulfurovum sp.]
MKKFLTITLITLLVLVILLAVLLFTQMGNDLVKPYLKEELEKQIGLPTEVETFKLRYDHIVLTIVIDKGLKVDVASDFNLLTQSFDGTYKIYANNFVYEGVSLDEANINGEFQGVPDDLIVNGKGTSFDAPLKYDLHVLEGEAKEIHVYIKDFLVSDILTLAKQPALAKGKVDANLTVPTLVKENLQANLNVYVEDVTFNDALMKKHYNLVLPESLSVQGDVDANLSGEKVSAMMAMKSKLSKTGLVNLNLDQLSINTKTKHLKTDYVVEILDLKSLSDLLKTKLDGVLLLKGKIEKTKSLKVTGITNSLGGEVKYALLDKAFDATLTAMPMQNMLKMFSFPPFVDANTSGQVSYDLLNKKGHTKLSLADFKLAPNDVTKVLGAVMPMNPTDIVFGSTALDANLDGDEVVYSLMAESNKASISIGEGRIDHVKDIHEASIKFAFDKYTIKGGIGGSIRQPYVTFDTKGFLKDQMMENDFAEKAEKEIKKFFKRLF